MEFGLAPVQSRGDFEAMRAQARLAESLGFSALWAHEHHSQRMMYPDALMTLAALAPATERIALGTNMLLLPIHHPVRVAQEAAMLDVLSGGRLRLGVANGYSATDFATFGISARGRGARLEMGLQVIRALFEGGPVTWQSDEFQLDGFELFPRPLQSPRPPIYVGGQAPVAIDRAARLGDGYLISTTETFDRVGEVIATYRAACAEHEVESPPPLLNRIVCVVPDAGTRAEAEAFYARALLALYDSWGHANVTALPDERRDPATVSREHFILGEPAECIERIEAYAALGVSHIACLMNFGGPDLAIVERSMRLLGEAVMPHVSAG